MPFATLIEVNTISKVEVIDSIKNISANHDNLMLIELNQSIISSGSIFSSANSDLFLDINDIENFFTGSIKGLSADFIPLEIYEDRGYQSGSILGSSTQDLYLEIDESYDNPLVEVNYVPPLIIQEQPVIEKKQKKRDISRFRKSYSFTRNKPVRFRTTKRI